MITRWTPVGGQCVGVTKRLTSAQCAEAAASIRRLIQRIMSDDLGASDIERAYLVGVLKGMEAKTEPGDCT